MAAKLRLLNFKASDEEIAAWDDVARRTHHRNRSRWIRETLNAAASGIPQHKFLPTPPLVETRPDLDVAKELASKAVTKKAAGKCANRLPKGTYCKGCGGIH